MVIYIMYYTAHHLGQVFVPYVIAGGTGMMLSCYLFHVETNLEQVFFLRLMQCMSPTVFVPCTAIIPQWACQHTGPLLSA